MAQPDPPDAPRAAGPPELPQQVIADLLDAAVAAPSMHNTQPWRFRVLREAQAIELHADPERALRYGDPDGRAVHIACGAALFNLRLAAAVAGREPVVVRKRNSPLRAGGDALDAEQASAEVER